eukprot:SAG22_NODE_2107_length_3004_cov_78.964888_2_plen_142_part_00
MLAPKDASISHWQSTGANSALNRPPSNSGRGGCCAPRPPKGGAWGAAYVEIGSLMDEVDAEVDKAIGGKKSCCGLQNQLKTVREHLDTGWTARFNETLQKHGLVAKLYDFWVYNGQSSSHHLFLYVYEPNDAPAPELPGKP